MPSILRNLGGVLLAALCACPANAEAPSKTAILKTTLASLDLANPTNEAERNFAHGDWRLIGVTDYSCMPPGREGIALEPLARTVGLRCLEGTSDALEGSEHERLDQVARLYAIAYNRRIRQLYCESHGCRL